MLPNALDRPLLYDRLERVVNKRGGVRLHVWQHVAVEVERDANLAVAKALAGDLWMYARGQQVRRVCVPQIVEPDAGQGASAEEADPFLAQAVRPQRQTIGSRCHEVVIR